MLLFLDSARDSRLWTESGGSWRASTGALTDPVSGGRSKANAELWSCQFPAALCVVQSGVTATSRAPQAVQVKRRT